MVSYGFYNSKNGDRKYDAEQFSRIFDGIIEDGVYMNIGDAFFVKESGRGDMEILVGSGRAWLNHTWTLNDSNLPLTVPEAEITLDRYDAVVIEVNTTQAVRANEIKIVKGTPGSAPEPPGLVNKNGVYQYPVAYIFVKAKTTMIGQADIEQKIGSSACPYVTGVLQTINIDSMVAEWEAQWERWGETKSGEFDKWFKTIKDQLTEDAAGKLQLQINEIKEEVRITEETMKAFEAIGWTRTEEV